MDNMAHASTTAHRINSVARTLGVDGHLRMHAADIWTLEWDDNITLDLIWVDFG